MYLKGSRSNSRKEIAEISRQSPELKQAFAKLSQEKVLEPWPNSYYRERKELLRSQVVEVVKHRIKTSRIGG